jgi:hypothetical protein
MDDERNPYAPPVEEPYRPGTMRTSEEAPPYYPVSTVKLVVLSVMTFRLYDLYWMYKQWKAIRDHSGVDLSTFWRTVFSVWFVYALFVDVRHRSVLADLRGDIPAGVLATLYIVFTILGRIGDKIDSTALWFMGFLAVLPLISMQGAINRYVRHHDPNADMNERFGAGSIIAILVGAPIWALILFGLLGAE